MVAIIPIIPSVAIPPSIKKIKRRLPENMMLAPSNTLFSD